MNFTTYFLLREIQIWISRRNHSLRIWLAVDGVMFFVLMQVRLTWCQLKCQFNLETVNASASLPYRGKKSGKDFVTLPKIVSPPRSNWPRKVFVTPSKFHHFLQLFPPLRVKTPSGSKKLSANPKCPPFRKHLITRVYKNTLMSENFSSRKFRVFWWNLISRIS